MSDIREMLKKIDDTDESVYPITRAALIVTLFKEIQNIFSDDQIARMLEAGPDRVIILPCNEGTPVYRVLFTCDDCTKKDCENCGAIREEPFAFIYVNHVKWGRLHLTYAAAKEAVKRPFLKGADQ